MSHLPRQDMPPTGGFPTFHFKRHIPRKGFSSLALLGICVATCTYGFSMYIPRQKAENARRLARIEERHAFLERLDKHLYEKHLQRVQKQAELDVIQMEKLRKGEKFVNDRPAEDIVSKHFAKW